MQTTTSHGMRNAIVITLVILGCGIFANIYLKNRGLPGLGSYDVGRRIAETPVFSFLPRSFLTRWAVPISQERNASVLKSVFEVFDPSLISFLVSGPIILDSSANTAKAYGAKGYIGVSPDGDNAVLQSPYRAI